MRAFGPLTDDHLLVFNEAICAICRTRFRAGDTVALVPAHDNFIPNPLGFVSILGDVVHSACPRRQGDTHDHVR